MLQLTHKFIARTSCPHPRASARPTAHSTWGGQSLTGRSRLDPAGHHQQVGLTLPSALGALGAGNGYEGVFKGPTCTKHLLARHRTGNLSTFPPYSPSKKVRKVNTYPEVDVHLLFIPDEDVKTNPGPKARKHRSRTWVQGRCGPESPLPPPVLSTCLPPPPSSSGLTLCLQPHWPREAARGPPGSADAGHLVIFYLQWGDSTWHWVA